MDLNLGLGSNRLSEPFFFLTLNSGETKTYFLRVQGEALSLLPLQIQGEKSFGTLSFRNYYVSVLSGAIVFFILSSLLLFIATRDRNYLFYILLLFITHFMLFSPALPWVFPELSLWWLNRIKESLGLGYDVSLLLLTISFFQLKENNPTLDMLSKILLFISVAVILSVYVVPMIVFLILLSIVTFAIWNSIIGLILFLWQQKTSGVRYFSAVVIPVIIIRICFIILGETFRD